MVLIIVSSAENYLVNSVMKDLLKLEYDAGIIGFMQYIIGVSNVTAKK